MDSIPYVCGTQKLKPPVFLNYFLIDGTDSIKLKHPSSVASRNVPKGPSHLPLPHAPLGLLALSQKPNSSSHKLSPWCMGDKLDESIRVSWVYQNGP
jgi:hypothetical protein